MSNTDTAELADLNMMSFKAEDEHSRDVLESILAEDFVIIRSNGAVENKQQMLDRVAGDTSKECAM